jgi:hypothetical protein
MMNRWLEHWRALPVRNRIGAAVSLVILIALIAIEVKLVAALF